VRLLDEVKFINNENDSIELALIQIKNERLRELKSCYSFLPYSNLGSSIFDEELFYMLFGSLIKKQP